MNRRDLFGRATAVVGALTVSSQAFAQLESHGAGRDSKTSNPHASVQEAAQGSTQASTSDAAKPASEAPTLTVRHVTIGKGQPKIVVPITGKSSPQVLEMAEKIAQSDAADLAEFRIDYLSEPGADPGGTAALCQSVRHTLGDKPLLATFRTKREGGEQAIDESDYERLYGAIITAKAADLVDIQMMLDESRVKRLVDLAHAHGVYVVMSNHNFHDTPPNDVLIARLRRQQSLGADILKIAAMPKTPSDALRLMQATREMYDRYAERPLLTMSMAADGIVSRLSGELTGSALTYGSIGASSAPGQLKAEELKTVLSIIHHSAF